MLATVQLRTARGKIMNTRRTIFAALTTFVLALSGCGSCGGGGGGGTTVGSLQVTVGFTAGSGESCTGSTTIVVTGPNGFNKTISMSYSGLAGQVDANHFGCTVSNIFSSLTPGSYTAKASPGGNCSKNVVAGNIATIFIWDTVCS